MKSMKTRISASALSSCKSYCKSSYPPNRPPAFSPHISACPCCCCVRVCLQKHLDNQTRASTESGQRRLRGLIPLRRCKTPGKRGKHTQTEPVAHHPSRHTHTHTHRRTRLTVVEGSSSLCLKLKSIPSLANESNRSSASGPSSSPASPAPNVRGNGTLSTRVRMLVGAARVQV